MYVCIDTIFLLPGSVLGMELNKTGEDLNVCEVYLLEEGIHMLRGMESMYSSLTLLSLKSRAPYQSALQDRLETEHG